MRRQRPARHVGVALVLASAFGQAPEAPASAAARPADHPLEVVAPDEDDAAAIRAALGGGHQVVVTVSAHPLETVADATASARTLPSLVLAADADIAIGCAQGLLRRSTDADCATAAMSRRIVLAAMAAPGAAPPRWNALWDAVRLPGRRGLPADGIGTLELALLADGVSPGDIYRTLATAGGAERAFRKLDQLRPYIAWWTDANEAARALASGAVILSVLPDHAWPSSTGSHVTTSEEGGLTETMAWAVPADAPNPAAASELLATLTRPDITAAIAAHRAGPGKGAGATPNASTPDRGALVLDAAFWRDHQALRARFRAWLRS